ncbi:MAG: DUF3047 domain-containing protein [Burkholderiales bacterium]|nr:DUF3047 domain-containing protein [Burkholderiales bacterium]
MKWITGLCLACSVMAAHAETPLTLGAVGASPLVPWQVTGLPRQREPFTQFSTVDLDGRRALRIEADKSYGNLVYRLNPARAVARLSWLWRVEALNHAGDLHTKSGDDTALKVCVFFDLPLEKVPFVERQLLRVARTRTSEPLPAATVCYVWDAHLPVGTVVPNAFTKRVRYKVLESGSARLHQWTPEKRNLAADFIELFGDESKEVPPMTGVAVGADADNTHGHSLAHVADLVLEP